MGEEEEMVGQTAPEVMYFPGENEPITIYKKCYKKPILLSSAIFSYSLTGSFFQQMFLQCSICGGFRKLFTTLQRQILK